MTATARQPGDPTSGSPEAGAQAEAAEAGAGAGIRGGHRGRARHHPDAAADLDAGTRPREHLRAPRRPRARRRRPRSARGRRRGRRSRRGSKTAGYSVSDIHTVIVTHSHPDHFGGAGRIKKEADAELVTHTAFTTWSLEESNRRNHLPTRGGGGRGRADRRGRCTGARHRRRGDPDDRRPHRRLRGRSAARQPDERAPGELGAVGWRDAVGRQQAPDAAVAPADDDPRAALPLPPTATRRGASCTASACELAGRDWVSIHTPGHTIDHLCLYDPEHGVLLSGDHVLPSITPHISGCGERRRRVEVVPADARSRRRARRRAARAARARSPVRRRARPRRGDQGAPRGAHGAARRGVARDRAGDRAAALATRSSPSATGV